MTDSFESDRSSPWQDAGVLVPVYRDGGGSVRLVVVRRSEGGVHGGQLAFPGGKREPADASLEMTAVREASEEIGIDPRTTRILGPLPVVDTFVSRFRIHPFLGRVVPLRQWRQQPGEIDEVIEVSLDDFTRPEGHGVETWQLAGWSRPERIAFYRVGSYKLWGATYRIVRDLLPRLAVGEWDV